MAAKKSKHLCPVLVSRERSEGPRVREPCGKKTTKQLLVDGERFLLMCTSHGNVFRDKFAKYAGLEVKAWR